jgi:hypothetical protein
MVFLTEGYNMNVKRVYYQATTGEEMAKRRISMGCSEKLSA